MVDVTAALAEALQWHLAGDLGRAEQAYRQILVMAPRNPDAWHRLALVAQQTGQFEAALRHEQTAIELAPQRAEFHLAWAEFHLACDDLGPAEAAFRTALALEPSYSEAYLGVGECFRRANQTAQAVAWFRKGVELAPQNFLALGMLADALLVTGEPAAAIPYYRDALRLNPDFTLALNNLGVAYRAAGLHQQAVETFRQLLELTPQNAEAHNNLGNIREDLGEWELAASQYAEAVRLNPAYAVAQGNLANAWHALGRFDEALERIHHALSLAPQTSGLWNTLGAILQALGRLDEARAAHQQAIELEPGYAEAWSNLCNVLHGLGRLDEALAAANRALVVAPDHPAIHCNRALAWLLAGNYAAGWPEYEWRLRRRETPQPAGSQPAWDGSPLGGQTILLHAEQGLGDTLQFVRYAPLVQGRGGRVVLQCQRPLVGLLARTPSVAAVVAQDDPLPPFDVHASLLSLPAIFQTLLDTVPHAVPYVQADPLRVRAWRDELAEDAAFRVGIAWQGNPKNIRDRARSIPLSTFQQLAEIPGVRLYSLQVGAGREQLDAWSGRQTIVDLSERLVNFDETAAVLSNLDLVISCDSAGAHLAGAMGMPVWIALPAWPDWRWLLGREDSPWYPTARLFRQAEPGKWEPTFARLAAELARHAADGAING